MKKRLISILLAICLVVTFFGTTTQVSACEEGNDVPVNEKATLNRNVQAWSINSEEMQQLNKGCEVYVYTKYPDVGGKWLCIISFGRYGSYIDVPMEALTFDKDVASENKPEQDSNGSDDHVGEYATLLRNVSAWSRDREKVEQLNKGCIVKILNKVKENGKYFYIVSFGRYGEFEKVPQDALSFEEDAPTANKPQEDSKNDKPNPEAEYAITTRIVFAVSEETGEVKQFAKGCRVRVLERTFEGGKNLCRISFGKYGKYKGMDQDALSFEDDAPSNDKPKEESSNKVTTNKDGIVRVATYLNGRSSPTWGNNIISKLKPNEMVEVLEISADKQWNLCRRSNGEKVWCYAQYIERGTWTKVLSKSSTSAGSSDNRLHNIALACRQLNGMPVILFPGDVFSWREWMGPSNASEGYKLANVITRAGVVLGYGGGVCQVSTTMNKAAKALGIETDAKKHFGNGVTYAKKEDEATVSYAGGVDFSFTNSTKDIIRLKMSADGETCTCTVYKLVRN